MAKGKRKEDVPLKAKVCTVISGIVVLLALGFIVYIEMPACKIQNVDNPIWAIPFLATMFLALAILFWGYK